MKKKFVRLTMLAAVFAGCLMVGMPVQAANKDTILEGVYAGNIELSGMTSDEAREAVEEYMSALGDVQISFHTADETDVTVSCKELGVSWSNPEIIEEAAGLGKSGNPIKRYKEKQDLKHETKVFTIDIVLDQEMVQSVVEDKCAKHDIAEKDYTLKRTNGQFVVVEGQTGYSTDVEKSISNINEFLTKEWNRQDISMDLVIVESKPKGSMEELSAVKDVLGTFTTDYHTSTTSRCENVQNGSKLVNGITVYPGDTFSLLDVVTPFTAENGYYMAGSYLSGKVVDSIGGGICQVSTTLYNAVLLAELDVTVRYNHSMIVGYVEPSADAAVAESAGKDFQFVNNTEYPIYIESYTTEDKKITFNIYGVETRKAGRQVRYESVVLSTDVPENEVVYADASQPIGYVSVQGAHIGYKAQLWKVVTENGVEVSRTQVNSSSYAKSPRSATVGTATGDADALAQINEAIATNNIDYVRSVAAALAAGGN